MLALSHISHPSASSLGHVLLTISEEQEQNQNQQALFGHLFMSQLLISY